MRVTLEFKKGPKAGEQRRVDLRALSGNKLLLGREPGPGGMILDGDVTVSRLHGELLEEQGQVVFVNHSANGTKVGDGFLMGSKALRPGEVLVLGSHEIEVLYLPSAASRQPANAAQGGVWQRGALARPPVRLLLAAYLLGLLSLTVFLGARGGSSSESHYREARGEYAERYLRVQGYSQAERAERLSRADRLTSELEAHIRAERWTLARDSCRELMALDKDTRSPIYRFAVRRLGDLASQG